MVYFFLNYGFWFFFKPWLLPTLAEIYPLILDQEYTIFLFFPNGNKKLYYCTLKYLIFL